MLTERRYSISTIQDDAKALVEKGRLAKRHQIYALSRYYSTSEWKSVEQVLENNDYLLRDSVCDLIGRESWMND
ncbi:MAG: DUF4327 family protein [Phormidesmis sp.]